jgi:hypothetical protein
MLVALALKPFEQRNFLKKQSSLLLHVKSYDLWLGISLCRSWVQHSISLKIDFEGKLTVFFCKTF